MTVLRNVLMLVLAAGTMSSASAQNAGRGRAYEQCLDKAVSNPAILDCMSVQYALDDKRLNVAYRALLARQKGARKTQLQEIQRMWLKYTEANCAFYDEPDGGTAVRLVAYECELSARAARADELEKSMQHAP